MDLILWRRKAATALTLAATGILMAASAQAFCGFYVGKADASLFNEASQVILVRDGDRTVLSMMNDYKGELKEFALVVPVPTVLRRDQINVGDRAIFDRLDSYSAPRLAEYHDSDPCARRELRSMDAPAPTAGAMMARSATAKAKVDSVKVEATYTIGEYDIVILSATESDGLETWLADNGYRVPAGASKALAPYIKQGLKFFVAKVNLKEHAKITSGAVATSGFNMLRPLQFAFESPRFMLPMRLGMVNANGPQDLIVYALTRGGRVESVNYRTVKLPANIDLPVFVRSDFKSFYKSLFDQHASRDQYKTVFTEYFWDMAWCDPCAADPLSQTELRKAGVFWLDPSAGERSLLETPGASPPTLQPNAQPNLQPTLPPTLRRPRPIPSAAQPVMLTRLHIRYTRDSFPEDLAFQETGDRQNYQTRYVLRHPFQGSPTACEAARDYYREVGKRQEREADTLAKLTGWNLTEIRGRMQLPAGADNKSGDGKPWWSTLWSS